MMASDAARLIGELVDGGMTQATIARAMGRDPAIVSRVRHGHQPGDSYVPFLRDLAAGDVAEPPSHRTGGRPPSRVARVSGGRVVTQTDSAQGVRAAVANAGRRTRDPLHLDGRGRVTLTVEGVDRHGVPWTRTLYSKGGYRADRLRARINEKIAADGWDPDGHVPEHVIADAVTAIADEDGGYTSGGSGGGIVTGYAVGTA